MQIPSADSGPLQLEHAWPYNINHSHAPTRALRSYLCNSMSAAISTGYEKRPSFNFALLVASIGEALGSNCSLLYYIVSRRITQPSVNSRPSIGSYEIDTPWTPYSSKSTSVLSALIPIVRVSMRSSRVCPTNRRLVEQSGPLWVYANGYKSSKSFSSPFS